MKIINIPYVSEIASKITEAFPFHNAACIDGKILGALWAIYQIRNVLPIIHGPIGCSWQRKFALMGSEIHYWTPCTAWSETEVVYGGEEKLYKAIVEAYEKFKPKMIVVLTTCASDMVGDDVEYVVDRARKVVKCPIVYSTGDKVGKTRQVGSQDVLYSIVEQYVVPNCENVEIEDGTVNLMTIGGEYSRSIVTELEGVLKAAGLRVNKIYFEDREVEELLELAKVRVNVVPYYQVWARYLSDVKGVRDFVLINFEEYDLEKAYPLGYEAAINKIFEICKLANVEPDEKSLERFYKPMLDRFEKIKRRVSGLKVCIENDWGTCMLFALKLGLKIEALVFWTEQYRGHGYSESSIKMMIDGYVQYLRQYGQDPEVIVDEKFENVIDKIKRRNIDLVITGWWSKPFKYHKNGVVAISSRNLKLFFEFGLTPLINAGEVLIKKIEKGIPTNPVVDIEINEKLPYLSKRWGELTLLFHLNRYEKPE